MPKLVSEEETELFAEIMQEIRIFCRESKVVEFESILPFIQNYTDVLPAQLTELFFDCLITMLDFDYKWKMPKPTDLRRLKINLPKLWTKQDRDSIDPLAFIDPDIMGSFIDAEKKALGKVGKFSSDIRCAAFCELLYERKHIKNTKTRRITIIKFAKIRYGIDITLAIQSTKNKERKEHQTQRKNNEIPLNNFF